MIERKATNHERVECMLDVAGVPYKIYLPVWVFRRANSKDEINDNARKYIERAFPEKRFLRVEGQFAICKSRI